MNVCSFCMFCKFITSIIPAIEMMINLKHTHNNKNYIPIIIKLLIVKWEKIIKFAQPKMLIKLKNKKHVIKDVNFKTNQL